MCASLTPLLFNRSASRVAWHIPTRTLSTSLGYVSLRCFTRREKLTVSSVQTGLQFLFYTTQRGSTVHEFTSDFRAYIRFEHCCISHTIRQPSHPKTAQFWALALIGSLPYGCDLERGSEYPRPGVYVSSITSPGAASPTQMAKNDLLVLMHH